MTTPKSGRQRLLKLQRVLAFGSRNIENNGRKYFMEVYKMLLRPELEYGVQFWSPHYWKDVIS